MNKKLAIGAVFAVAFLAGADAPKDDAAKKELERFSGTWKAVSVVRDGEDVPREEAGKITLTVKGEKYTFKTGSQTVEGTHKLDPSKRPRTIDAVRTKGPNK